MSFRLKFRLYLIVYYFDTKLLVYSQMPFSSKESRIDVLICIYSEEGKSYYIGFVLLNPCNASHVKRFSRMSLTRYKASLSNIFMYYIYFFSLSPSYIQPWTYFSRPFLETSLFVNSHFSIFTTIDLAFLSLREQTFSCAYFFVQLYLVVTSFNITTTEEK